MKKLAIIAAGALVLAACTDNTSNLTKSGLDPEKFLTDSTALYTLTNASGVEVCITNYGGRIVSLMVPDRTGEFRDIVLGFDSIEAYFPENNATDFGAAIGRYANRIDHGRFVLDGDTIQLPTNNYGHTLHGGPHGWQYVPYEVTEYNDSVLVLTMHSPKGDACFPGAVDANVRYTLCSNNSLRIEYDAVTDAPTIINMTNHAYFNLSGDPRKTILDETLWINAKGFTPVDSTFMTDGTIAPVEGTPMDFTTPKTVGQDIVNYDFVQLANGNGYDHNFVLDTDGNISIPAAYLADSETGIVLTVFTNEPGLQVYAGNFLDGTVTGKHGIAYNQRTAICLETQHFPDSPNKPQWPSVVLRPGEKYQSTCIYNFSVSE